MRQLRSINLQSENPLLLKRPKRKILLVTKIILIIGLLGLAFLAYKIITTGKNSLNFWVQIKHLITSQDKKLAGETEDRINILLLGVGGINHEGPYLSDTIILASFKPSTKQLATLAIPRDLLVPIPEIGFRKINYAYALGEAKQAGGGGQLASTVISNVFGVPVHYYARLDFAGFEKIIDVVGGVTINVENAIDDEFYPIAGKENATTSERYQHFYLEKGIRFMNGETALKFVRSRKAKGVEGSDFARSKRQQKMLLAVKDKIISATTLLNPGILNRLTKTLSEHLDTNLEIWEMLRFYSLGKSISSANIITQVLNDDPKTGLLAADVSVDAFILKPRTGDFLELQSLAKNIFEAEAKTVDEFAIKNETPPTRTEEKIIPKENYNLEIHNGTKINGLAAKTAQLLKKQGYQIIKIGNAPIQTYKKTLIYAISPDQIEKSVLTDLEKKLKAIIFTSGAPANLTNSAGQPVPYPLEPETDILIILGEDAETKF